MNLTEQYPRLAEIEDYTLKHVVAAVFSARGIGPDQSLVNEMAEAVEEFALGGLRPFLGEPPAAVAQAPEPVPAVPQGEQAAAPQPEPEKEKASPSA